MSKPIELTDLLESVAGRVEMGELYEVRSDELPVTFSAGELESIRSVQTAGRALRVIHQGRLGFSTTTDLADDSTLVQNALASAQFGDPVAFEFPAQPSPSAVQCFDADVERMDEEQLIALGREAADRLRAHDPDLQIEVSLVKRIDRVHLANTNGLDRTYASTGLSLWVEAIQTRGDDILILGRHAAARRRPDIDGPALAEHVIERLRWCERTAQVRSGVMPVIFRSEATLALLLPLLLGLNGRNVYLGTSPLGDRLGRVAFDSRLTLTDDGRADYGVRSAPIDDEGVPTETKEMVGAGEVRRFLYDLRTAAQVGAEPTGNGFKSSGLFGGGYQEQPGVAPTNWLLSPGESSLDEILAGLDEALLVEGLIGMGQGNILAGEFSNNVGVGFLVRRGEVVGRVKNTMIAGNVYELLRDSLLALSDQPEQVFGMLSTPAIAIDAVSVVGAG
jgi:PmbA protein